MKWLTVFLLALCAYAQPSSPEIARAAAEELAQGRLEAFRARFDPSLMETESPEQVAASYREYFHDAGGFEGIGKVTCKPFDDKRYQGCFVLTHFRKSDITLVIDLDREGRVGLYVPSGVEDRVLGLFSLSNTPDWVVFYLLPWSIVLGSALWLHFWPVRRGLFFDIPAEPAFRTSPDGVALLKRYRRWNVSMALLGIVLIVASHFVQHPVMSISYFIHIIAMAVVTVYAHSRVWPHRLRGELERVADLSDTAPLPKWLWLLGALPALILAVTTWYLATHWDAIPASTPIHLGTDGQADQWEIRTFKNVFGYVLLGWSILLLFYAHAVLVVWGTRRSATELRVVRAFNGSLIGIMLSIAAMFAQDSLVFSGLHPDWIQSPLTWLPQLGIVVSIIPLWWMMNNVPPGGDPTPRECWRAVWFYVNPADPAWAVRIGFGFAPNLGHRWILVLTTVLLMQLIGAAIYVMTR